MQDLSDVVRVVLADEIDGLRQLLDAKEGVLELGVALSVIEPGSVTDGSDPLEVRVFAMGVYEGDPPQADFFSFSLGTEIDSAIEGSSVDGRIVDDRAGFARLAAALRASAAKIEAALGD